MKVRIKFAKRGVMRYVGHLDIMRYFQKAMRRAGIPIRYSEGFNPHQLMSFAAPLGVGLTSEGEYMDIELKEQISPEKAVNALNQTMAEGMEILSFRYLPDHCQNAMASVCAASYEMRYKKPELCPFSVDELQKQIQLFYGDPEEILITKKTKKGERSLDLKPLIYDFKVTEEDHVPVFSLFLSTGSTDNIKPELVMEHFHQCAGMDEFPQMDIKRMDLFMKQDDAFIPLGDAGSERL